VVGSLQREKAIHFPLFFVFLWQFETLLGRLNDSCLSYFCTSCELFPVIKAVSLVLSVTVDLHHRWITISLSTVAMRLFILPTLIVQLQKTAKIGQIMQKCKSYCSANFSLPGDAAMHQLSGSCKII
jgi:hypothetical protein